MAHVSAIVSATDLPVSADLGMALEIRRRSPRRPSGLRLAQGLRAPHRRHVPASRTIPFNSNEHAVSESGRRQKWRARSLCIHSDGTR